MDQNERTDFPSDPVFPNFKGLKARLSNTALEWDEKGQKKTKRWQAVRFYYALHTCWHHHTAFMNRWDFSIHSFTHSLIQVQEVNPGKCKKRITIYKRVSYRPRCDANG